MTFKKFCLVAFIAVVGLACGLAFAVEIVKEAPVYSVGTPTRVDVSTSAWTKVPTTSSLKSRSGVKVCNPASNTASMFAIISTFTPTVGITVGAIEVEKGENPFIPVGDQMDLYMISVHTASETVRAQEVRQ